MSTVAAPEQVVTGGVDTHPDTHVAAALDHLGGVLGTASFPTSVVGYRRLLTWLRSFGPLGRVGVEGTGSYGASLARYLAAEHVEVVEVSRPNRQIRRRHGKTDVVDAIAAARAVMSGEATATPKTHDGAVESLRMLKVLQRSANQARTQALNQLRSTLVTASPELRARLQSMPRRELLATCAAFCISAENDSLAGITRLTLRDLAQRVLFLDERLVLVQTRLRRITDAGGDGVCDVREEDVLMILPKVRDPRLVAVRRGGTLTDEDHRLIALWSATCAEHVLHSFESVRPQDPRPRRAIEQVRAWARGEVRMMETRAAGGSAMAAARELRGAARHAAYAAGQAAVVAHVAEHDLGAAAYAIKAAVAAAPQSGSEAARVRECRWQQDQLPDAVRDLVLEDQRRRNQLCWSVFDC